MRNIRNNKGFILVLVLAVLVIASTVLAGWAYRISSGALYAAEVSREVQRKWATLSCRKLFLPAAEDILQKKSEQAGEPVAIVVQDIRIGEMVYHLVLSDEQAKVNVASLVKHNGNQQAAEQLQQLMPDTVEGQSNIELNLSESSTAYNSFDQVFDYGNDPSRLVSIERLTFWGDGLINCNRADKDALEVMTAGILSNTDLQKLLDLRNENLQSNSENASEENEKTNIAKLGLKELFAKLGLHDQQTKKLEKILTDKSSCKSLWVICNDGNRNWYGLYIVQDDPDKDRSKSWSYQW